MSRKYTFLCVLSAVTCLVATAEADVKLPALFSDNMVLQRNMPIPIWGWAAPGETITASLDGQSASAVATADGKWLLRLPKRAEGGPYELVVKGDNEIVIKNVMVGEVWVCSGQSNMEWTVRRAGDAEREMADANYPLIRHFKVAKNPADEIKDDCAGKWEECNPKNVGDFTAIGYYFARELYSTLHISIGLINTSWSGTPVQDWTSAAAMRSEPTAREAYETWLAATPPYDANKAEEEYQKKLAEWKVAAEKAKADGTKAPSQPKKQKRGPGSARLYNGMIAPLIPYGIAGAIWYQGETNALDKTYVFYEKWFPLMINNWRKDWGQGDFPFYYVQLANFMKTEEQPSDGGWPRVQEAQLHVLKTVPNVGMAVTIDIGEADNIHPKNKQGVGQRLALWARTKMYGQNKIAFSGPIFKSAEKQGDKFVITFDYVDGGLVAMAGPTAASAPTSAAAASVKGFAIAGADRQFVWAEAKIEGDKVIVWSKDVTDPIAVRYAWANNPVCNLYNSEGLPASPFRTDNLAADFKIPASLPSPATSSAPATAPATAPVLGTGD